MFAAHKPSFRLLCCLMAVITPLAPSASVWAQTPAAPAASEYTRFVLPYSAAIVSVRPRQLMMSEMAQMMPVEVVQAACIKEMGFDPLLVDRIVFSMIPPLAGPPSYAILIEFTERIDLGKLSPKLTQHTVPAQRDGQSYLQSQTPQEPSLIWVGETSLLLAPEHSLNQLLSSTSKEPDEFAQQFAPCEGDDLAAIVNLTVLRPLIQMGLNQAAQEVPSEFQEYMEIPSLLERVRLRVNLTGKGPLELSCAANDAAAADRIEDLIEQLMSLYRRQASQQAAKMLQSEDPVEQAMGRYVNRITPVWSEQLVPTRNGERFTIFETSAEDNIFGGPASIATIGVLVALLLPAVQAAREAARRAQSMNNTKQILLAMHNYHDVKGRFPAHATYSKDKQPLLSWRVHILPYIEQENLYKQFRLDEPWDSQHNRSLIPLMPVTYLDPSSPNYTEQKGHTHYLAVKGEGFAFDGTERGRGIASFRDGTANTIMIVQCNDGAAVPWTKPQDLEPSKQTPLAGLVPGIHPAGFLAGFTDGHVQFMSKGVDPAKFLKLLTIADGEIVNLD